MFLEITHSASPIQAVKNFDPSLTVSQLKDKIVSIVGTPAVHQVLQLIDPTTEQVLNANLLDDNTLEFYNVQPNMRIHVLDTDPSSNSMASIFNDPSVKKYEISEEDYDARNDTFRKWASKNLPTKAKKPLSQQDSQMPTDVQIGQRCEIQNSLKPRGVVRYIGKLDGKDGFFLGVQLDEPVGNCDGTHMKKRYFTCAGKTSGIFVPVSQALVGDYPERNFLDEDEI